MKTISKTLLSLGLSLLVGAGAFAQTADQDKDKKHKEDNKTSELQDSQNQQDFTNYDSDQDGQLNEDEFVVVYTEVYRLEDASKSSQSGEATSETSTSAETSTSESSAQVSEEMISSQFETIDEDSNGYIDEEEYKSWMKDTETK